VSTGQVAVPQTVPAGWKLPTTQVGLPDAHEMVPITQAFDSGQAPPAVQGTQLPALQTMPLPQSVPFGAAVPLSWQVILPLPQPYVPTWHGLAGVQLPPAEHETQSPSSHTFSLPHEVPFGAMPVSAHTEAPVTQDVVPVRQASLGWQSAPVVQGTQLPALQTLLVPHSVPLARFLPVSEQVMVGAQTVMPAWQALPPGVQAMPAVHDTQLPSLQTRFVPQEVPLVKFPVSVQTGTPVPQAIAPVRHGLPLTVQLAPA
jgi:hypothetical protein